MIRRFWILWQFRRAHRRLARLRAEMLAATGAVRR